jgi:hypothetical protein
MFRKLFGTKEGTTYVNTIPVGSVTPDTTSLNLIKDRAREVRTLCTEKGITNKSRVAICLDYSGSMGYLYSSGEVQRIFERLFPIGFNFDDNREVDLFIFESGAKYIGTVNLDNYTGVIQHIVKNNSMGGTNYTPAFNLIEDFYSKPGDPVYVLFLADGDCGDKDASKSKMIELSKKGIFFQFIGLGNANMNFLEKLDDMKGRTVDNADFFRISSQDKITDSELYGKLMTEYPSWLTAARAKNII